jgi:hypothetical protein
MFRTGIRSLPMITDRTAYVTAARVIRVKHISVCAAYGDVLDGLKPRPKRFFMTMELLIPIMSWRSVIAVNVTTVEPDMFFCSRSLYR